MDKAKLIERRDALVRNREQIVANVNMLQGMIEEINFWIRAMEKEDEIDGCEAVMQDNARAIEIDAVEAEAEAEEEEAVGRTES